MITIQSAESALKNIYLESVINDINTKTNPFLTMVQNNARTVAGKEARASIRYGNEGKVATGTEGGALPEAVGKVAEIAEDLKNVYGTFQISDKAIRAAQNSPGAFASLLGGEMQNLVSTAQSNLNTMLYGNGRRLLAHAENLNIPTRTFTVPQRWINNLKVDMFVDILNADNRNVNSTPMRIFSINKGTGAVEVQGSFFPNRFDRLYIYEVADQGLDLNGIDSIFMQDTMYNLNLSEHEAIRPYIGGDRELNGTLEVLNEDAIMKFFDGYEEHCEGIPADILLTHPNVRRAVFENLRDLRSNVDTTELAGGFKGFSFNGIPVYSDLKCKAGTLYALNSDSWAMHQLVDWTWLSHDDGSVLKPLDGRAGYSATLVKYADLICDKPFIQGKVTNYSALKSV